MAGGSKTSRRDQSSIEFKWVPLDAPPVDLSDIHREEDICTPSDTNKQSSKQSELTSSEILSTSQLVSAIGKVWGLANRPLPVFQPKDNVEHNESFHHNDIAGCYSGWKIRKTSTADFGDFHIDHKCAKHYYDMVNPNIEFIGAFQKTLLSKTDSGLSNTSRLWRYTLFDYSYRSVEPWKAQGLSSSGISFDLGSLYERTKEKWSHDLNYPIPKVQVECKNPGEATSQTTSAGNLSAECSECSTSANKSKDSTSVNSVKSVQSKDKSVTTLHSANSLKVVTDIKKIKEVSSIHSSGHHDLQGLNNCVDKQGENIPESKDMLKREDHVHQGAPTKELCSVLGDKSKYSLPSQKHALAGALSGTFVSLCLHPVDTIKTVIQSGSMAEKSIFQIGRTVVSDRGIIGLYRGIASNIASSAPISAVYTYTYESVKAALLPILPKEYQSIGHCMAGGCASIATSVIFTPSERIKQQMQVSSQYQNCWAALVGILGRGGLSSLYVGWGAVLCRNIPHSIIKFYTYETLKQLFEPSTQSNARPSTYLTLICGGLAGSTAALFTTPLDVVKTRLQIQIPGSLNKYDGVFHALKEISKEEGLGGLYRGLTPRLVMYISQGALFFASYELFKSIFAFELPEIYTPAIKKKQNILLSTTSPTASSVRNLQSQCEPS